MAQHVECCEAGLQTVAHRHGHCPVELDHW
jgi:hypothetical protein